MVKRPVFERGDIVRFCLNPVAGRELQGDFRPALVLSPASFNRLGMTLVAPITQGGDFSRQAGFAVTLLGAGTETQGVVLVNQVRMVDLGSRGGVKVEDAQAAMVEEVLARLMAVLESP